jgi:hypothetical protein
LVIIWYYPCRLSGRNGHLGSTAQNVLTKPVLEEEADATPDRDCQGSYDILLIPAPS